MAWMKEVRRLDLVQKERAPGRIRRDAYLAELLAGRPVEARPSGSVRTEVTEHLLDRDRLGASGRVRNHAAAHGAGAVRSRHGGRVQTQRVGVAVDRPGDERRISERHEVMVLALADAL